VFSTSLWAAGVNYYHWKDMELPMAGKDRLFINYYDPNFKLDFPGVKLYSSRELKGEPSFEFNSKGTFEKGVLKCALNNYECQAGPLYKRPWAYRDSGSFGIFLPLEKQLDDTTFEVKYEGKSYFLSLSTLTDYKLITVKFDSTEHLMGKTYWIQKSHSYLIQKFKEKMPSFDEEKKKAIECLRSKDNKCIEKYSIGGGLKQLKSDLLEQSTPSDNPNHSELSSFDDTINNASFRTALASCLEQGKVMNDFFTVPRRGLFSTTLKLYSPTTISVFGGYNFSFECSFGFKADKSGTVKSLHLGFSHHLDT
jgi:hypothetical protein